MKYLLSTLRTIAAIGLALGAASCNDVPFAIDPGATAPELIALERWTSDVAILHPRMSDPDFVRSLLLECDPEVAMRDSLALGCHWGRFQVIVDSEAVPTRIVGDTVFGAPADFGGVREVSIIVDGHHFRMGRVRMRGLQSSCDPELGNLPTAVGLDRLVTRVFKPGGEWLEVVDLETCESRPVTQTWVGWHTGLSFRGPGYAVTASGEVWDVNRAERVATVPCDFYEMNVEIAPGVCFGTQNNQTVFWTPAGSSWYHMGGEGHADPVVSGDGFAIMINDHSHYVTELGIPVFDTDSIRSFVEGDHVLGAAFTPGALHVLAAWDLPPRHDLAGTDPRYVIRSYSLAGELIQSAEIKEPLIIKGAYLLDDSWIVLALTKPRLVEEGEYWFTSIWDFEIQLLSIDRSGTVHHRAVVDRVSATSGEWYGEVRLFPARDPSVVYVQTWGPGIYNWGPRIYKMDFGAQSFVY